MKIGFIACALCLSIVNLSGQSFAGHPPGLHWQKLKTETGNIFYPKNIEAKAFQVAHTIRHFYESDSTLGHKRFKINIVLQNQTIQSNGYVGIGPFLSEYYLTPPHDPYLLGAIDWTNALSIHEYRHVLQAMNSRVGINNFLYYVLGEEAWGASYGFAVPDWFAEGDAVYAETIHSNGGRGKMPSFLSTFRALDQDHIFWNYAKVRAGSYRSLVPNHYVYGYTMVKYVHDHYGSNAWKSIFDDAVRYKKSIIPFPAALKKYTGMNERQLYKKAISELKSDTLDLELQDESILKNNQSSVIKNFISPNALKNGSLIYLETASDHLPQLKVLYPDQHIKMITQPGITVENDYTFKEPLACWTEITKDPRWDDRDYSDIMLYNIKTNVKIKLSNRQKYVHPSLSHDLTKIVCVEYKPDGSNALVIMDTRGVILHHIDMVSPGLNTFPIFETGDTTILSILRSKGTSSIVQFNISNGTMQTLVSPLPALMANLMEVQDTIYFSSDLSGRDNLYVFDVKHRKLFQITQNSIGIRQYHVRGNELWYNYPTSTGIQVRKKKIIDCKFIEIELPNTTDELSQHLEERVGSDKSIGDIHTAGRLNNPFRVYSWSIRPDEGGNVFRILGRNVLNTISATSAYSYQPDEKTHSINNSVSIGAGYPIITATISNTFNRHLSNLSNTKDSILWNETGLRIGASVPLHYYIQNQVISFQPTLQFGQYIPNYKLGERKNYQPTQFIRSGFAFSAQRRQAVQHVSSRSAISVSLQWNRALNHQASAVDLLTAINLPGWSKNHVIEFNLNLHRQLIKDPYRFSIPSRFIAGYQSFTSDQFTWSRVAYHFPLMYPDFGINRLFFIKRIRSRLFGEMMNNTLIRNPKDLKINYHTVGSELLFDGTIWYSLPLSIGVRYSQPLDIDLIRRSRLPQFEFLIESFF